MDASKFKHLLTNQTWGNLTPVIPVDWDCGYCATHVGSDKGWQIAAVGGQQATIRICSNCHGPAFFLPGDREYSPSPLPGRTVQHVPADLAALYGEARASAGAGAPTAAVMACRKILMHIAVEEGAKPGQTFVAYVDHLVNNHYAPPKSKVWVDFIRTLGNDANHEIKLMTTTDAQIAMKFVEMLFEFLYEAQGMVPTPPTTSATSNT
jgi:hypothetical protein